MSSNRKKTLYSLPSSKAAFALVTEDGREIPFDGIWRAGSLPSSYTKVWKGEVIPFDRIRPIDDTNNSEEHFEDCYRPPLG